MRVSAGLWVAPPREDLPRGVARSGAMPADLAERGDDVLALDLLEAAAPRRRARRDAACRPQLGRQVLRLDLVALPENDGALDRVLELPHVARPVVRLHAAQGRRGEALASVGRVL